MGALHNLLLDQREGKMERRSFSDGRKQAKPKVKEQRTRDGAGGVKSWAEISLRATLSAAQELGRSSEWEHSQFHFSELREESDCLGAV